uniref:Uncharacterized protein n=1 Tax=viral metagenome TaxID=1070528 RepID=A0A6C0BTW2_9ZZZZ
MDDFKLANLSEAQNEYSARLINTLTPFIRQGIQSIFNEAYKLCDENDEREKYLMTFQNFLSRVSKWNNSLVEKETERIVNESKCSYLEDLLTCVHVTQLKVLTSVRVGQKQKKIDLDVPKLSVFIHRVYIETSRKIYKNVYLFDLKASPLNHQKNMRECELIIKECILNVIRESIPIEKILRSYIDKTTETEVTLEEEIIHEEKPAIVEEKPTIVEEKPAVVEEKPNNIIKEDIVQQGIVQQGIVQQGIVQQGIVQQGIVQQGIVQQGIIEEHNVVKQDTLEEQNASEQQRHISLSFNDVDKVLNMSTNKEERVEAPKTIDRLESISNIRNEERKKEDEEEAEDDIETLTINSDLDPNELDGAIESLDDELMKLSSSVENEDLEIDILE